MYARWLSLTEALMFPGLAHLLQSAVRQGQGEQTLQDVWKEIWKGESMLLVVLSGDHELRAALTVKKITYPSFDALRIVLGGGEGLREWAPVALEKLEEECAIIGASQIEFFGRPGFARALKDMGTPAYTVMVRKVSDERRRRNHQHQHQLQQ